MLPFCTALQYGKDLMKCYTHIWVKDFAHVDRLKKAHTNVKRSDI